MQQHHRHTSSTDHFQRTQPRAVVALTNNPSIESTKRPVVREHAMDKAWENGTLRARATFTKARTHRQLI